VVPGRDKHVMSGSPGDGLRVVREKLGEWYAVRAELRAIEEAEHPVFRDQWGREWTWVSGDLWHHDSTLAYPRDMVDALRGLPPETLRKNPNYHKLCGTCRSQWADTSPVSPRILLKGQGWFDVRDGLYYTTQEGDEPA
jgi:hypothetical protein